MAPKDSGHFVVMAFLVLKVGVALKVPGQGNPRTVFFAIGRVAVTFVLGSGL